MFPSFSFFLCYFYFFGPAFGLSDLDLDIFFLFLLLGLAELKLFLPSKYVW